MIKKRSELAKKESKLTNGTMSVAMNIDYNIVDSLCNEVRSASQNVAVVCYNSDKQVMISGTEDAVRVLEKNIIQQGGDVIPLISSATYHSPSFGCIYDFNE